MNMIIIQSFRLHVNVLYDTIPVVPPRVRAVVVHQRVVRIMAGLEEITKV